MECLARSSEPYSTASRSTESSQGMEFFEKFAVIGSVLVEILSLEGLVTSQVPFDIF